MKTTKFYRKKRVLDKVPFSESTLFRRIQEGTFPAPYSLGGNSSRAIGWSAEEIDDWLNSRQKINGGQDEK